MSLTIAYRQPPVSGNGLCVTPVGIPSRPVHVYLYGDLLEELHYNATLRVARGLLMGAFYTAPVDNAADAPSGKKTDYVLVSSFQDTYPVAHALDYAGYLRRLKNYTNNGSAQPILGTVFMSPEPISLYLEDLMLQRSYFASSHQIALYVEGGSACPRVFMLDDDAKFIETGYFIIHTPDMLFSFDLSASKSDK